MTRVFVSAKDTTTEIQTENRRDGARRPSGGGARKGKKEIYFGTFLGNSGAGKGEE